MWFLMCIFNSNIQKLIRGDCLFTLTNNFDSTTQVQDLTSLISKSLLMNFFKYYLCLPTCLCFRSKGREEYTFIYNINQPIPHPHNLVSSLSVQNFQGWLINILQLVNVLNTRGATGSMKTISPKTSNPQAQNFTCVFETYPWVFVLTLNVLCVLTFYVLRQQP